MSSMAAAWYPCDTNTSSAASSSCRRRSCRGSRVLRGLVSDVAVKIRSPRSWRADGLPRSPHPKLPSAVVVIVEADRALLLSRVGLVHVERHLTPDADHGLIRDQLLVLLDGVVLGRFYALLTQRSGPLFLLVGHYRTGPYRSVPYLAGPGRTGPGSSQLPERCLQCFPVGREGMHDIGEDRDGNLGPDGEGYLTHPAGRVRAHGDRAGQHSGLGVGVQLEAAQVVLAQLGADGVAEAGPGRDQPRARDAGPGLARLILGRHPGDPQHRAGPLACLGSGHVSRGFLGLGRPGDQADREDGRGGEHAARERAVVRLAGIAEDV